MRVKCVKPQDYSMGTSNGIEPLYNKDYKRMNSKFRRYLRVSNMKRILNILSDEIWRNVQ